MLAPPRQEEELAGATEQQTPGAQFGVNFSFVAKLVCGFTVGEAACAVSARVLPEYYFGAEISPQRLNHLAVVKCTRGKRRKKTGGLVI